MGSGTRVCLVRQHLHNHLGAVSHRGSLANVSDELRCHSVTAAFLGLGGESEASHMSMTWVLVSK